MGIAARLAVACAAVLGTVAPAAEMEDSFSPTLPGPPLEAKSADLADALSHYAIALQMGIDGPSSSNAIAHLEQAHALNPEHLPLAGLLAAAYARMNRVDSAIAVMRDACRRHPRSADARTLLGYFYQSAGQKEQALKEYRRAVRVEPAKPDAYIRQATIYLENEEYGEAQRIMARAFAAVSNKTDILLFCDQMVRAYILNAKVGEAIGILELLASEQPENLAIKERLARCYASVGDKRRSVGELLVLAERQPTNAIWHFYLGDLYEQMGETNRAIASLERAIEADPSREDYHIRLALLYLRSDPSKAHAALLRAVQLFPNDPVVCSLLGLVLSHNRSFKDAITLFERAEASAASSNGQRGLPGMFYFWYGAACEQDGRSAKAEELLERAIEIHPDSHESYNYLAYMWAEAGTNLEKALQYVTRALEMQPGEPAYEDTLGWIYYKQGRYADALEHVGRALRKLKGDPTVLEHMGDIHAAMNRIPQAVAYWKKSLQVEPGRERVREKLRRHDRNGQKEPR